jgi:hypothetical protein
LASNDPKLATTDQKMEQPWVHVLVPNFGVAMET